MKRPTISPISAQSVFPSISIESTARSRFGFTLTAVSAAVLLASFLTSHSVYAADETDEDSILLKREQGRCSTANVTLPPVLAEFRPKKYKNTSRKTLKRRASEERKKRREREREEGTGSALSSLFDLGAMEEEGSVSLSEDGLDVDEGDDGFKKTALDRNEIAIEGDQLESGDGGGTITMRGDAQITQGLRGVFADEIRYDRDNYMAHAEGDVNFYSIGGDLIKTESMRLEVDTFIGEAGKGEMYIAERNAALSSRTKNYVEDYTFFAPLTRRIKKNKDEYIDDDEELPNDVINATARVTADHIDIEDANFQRLTNANLTRCPEGNRDVEILGDEVELDHGTGLAHLSGAQLRFKGVPIFYAPRLTLPLGTQRKSGFLMPSIGDDDVNGMTVAVPYYLNLAPNYDATITPTWFADRGSQVYAEFRMLGDYSDGHVKMEYMPEDALFENEARHAIGMEYKLDMPSGLGARIDLQDLSDTEYMDDFNNDVDINSSVYLPQTGEVFYRNDLLDVAGRVRKYELVDEELESSRPYDMMPQLTLELHPDEIGMFEFGLDSEYVQFDHVEAEKLNGTRLNMKPWVGVPYEPVWGFVKPKVSLRNVSYSLNNVQPGDDDAPSASVPVFSVDSGLFFERDVEWDEKEYLHTLEPRVMYVNVPKKEQDALPDFDTSQGSSSSYSYLFREDRFFGGDKIGDDHHIAIGVSSALIDDDDGKEKIKASIGQMYYLSDREIHVTETAIAKEEGLEDRSDVFGEMTANLTDDISMNGSVRWDHKDEEINNYNFGFRYDDTYRRQVSVDYTFSRNLVEGEEDNKDIHLTLDWPITDRIQVGTEQRYDITDGEVHSSTYSLTYDACCWAIGIAAQSNLQDDGEYRDSILATFELAGIGRFQTDGTDQTGSNK